MILYDYRFKPKLGTYKTNLFDFDLKILMFCMKIEIADIWNWFEIIMMWSQDNFSDTSIPTRLEYFMRN